MKLATLDNGTRDGQLAIVSKDLKRCTSASAIAPNLQSALDSWSDLYPALEDLSRKLNQADIAGKAFEPHLTLAPLPRAYQWIDASAYLTHLQRVRAAKGSLQNPQDEKPIMYQGGSDHLLGAEQDIEVNGDDLALDYEAEIAVILGDVPKNPTEDEARNAVRLITQCNDVSLRRLVAADLQDGFGFFHSKPATAFGPVVVTPDELGAAWQDGRVAGQLQSRVNGLLYGQPRTEKEMVFNFYRLIQAAAQTRHLRAGTILGGGTVANTHDEILPISSDGVGFSCIVEARMAEKAADTDQRTPFLKDKDQVSIQFVTDDGDAPFGEIKQSVAVKTA
ncbi:fumarylacetoacetate hydrolase family protein [Maritalea mediterranea]|uniref:Fumarylacetoacetate hydrolase family protein n=1 Tax=Maritalea mediterranea TaxID=2909667 RepID=A0ABS9E773_9HYPH|nr:fumarylacetoacetate hydrolase family protein [Maritalea mediterranea]MCF4098034.1 fumarylacetoacetate hydrolase family protein [Maritalea mediterranea]